MGRQQRPGAAGPSTIVLAGRGPFLGEMAAKSVRQDAPANGDIGLNRVAAIRRIIAESKADPSFVALHGGALSNGTLTVDAANASGDPFDITLTLADGSSTDVLSVDRGATAASTALAIVEAVRDDTVWDALVEVEVDEGNDRQVNLYVRTYFERLCSVASSDANVVAAWTAEDAGDVVLLVNEIRDLGGAFNPAQREALLIQGCSFRSEDDPSNHSAHGMVSYPGGVQLYRKALTYADFAGAAQRVTVNLSDLSGKVLVFDAWVQSGDVDFAGGNGTTIEVGDQSDDDGLVTALDVESGTPYEHIGLAAADKGAYRDGRTIIVDYGSNAVTATVDAGTGKTCNDLTAGELWVCVSFVELPA